jgi:cysteine desulfurase
MNQKIYLDNNATTAVDPRVIDEIILSLKSTFGNPSSTHQYGQQAKARLQKARDDIAKYLKVLPQEIIFTSGATEALNLILRGFNSGKNTHVISSDVEHPAVYTTLKSLENENFNVLFVRVGLKGAVTLEDVKKACRSDTSLITLMAVNNETGVKTDISAIASFAKARGIPFVVDGVALLGKESFEIPDGVTAMCFSGHKIHALKGIGFAFIRKGFKLIPSLTGGNQEFGMRGGTENLTGIIALQESIRLLQPELETAQKRMESLRDKLEDSLLKNLSCVRVNGKNPRVVNTSNLCFSGIEGELLMANLDMEGVHVSLGSACASGALEPSRVLLNMGLSLDDASSSIRISLSRFTTEDEIDRATDIIIRTVNRIAYKGTSSC